MNFKAFALLFLSSLSFKVAEADSGFARSCQDSGVYQPGYGRNDPPHNVLFESTCRMKVGIYNVDVVIDLNYCFANDSGTLHARPKGGFGGSCWDLWTSGSVLHATCSKGSGKGSQSTSIDLNDWVGNYDGRLKCFGQSGF